MRITVDKTRMFVIFTVMFSIIYTYYFLVNQGHLSDSFSIFYLEMFSIFCGLSWVALIGVRNNIMVRKNILLLISVILFIAILCILCLFSNDFIKNSRRYMSWIVIYKIYKSVYTTSCDKFLAPYISWLSILLSLIYILTKTMIDRTVSSINSIYFIFLLIPLLVYYRKKIYFGFISNKIALILACIACAISLKGVILYAFLVVVAIYLFSKYRTPKAFLNTTLFLITVVILITVVFDNINIFDIFTDQLADGGNGRLNLSYLYLTRFFHGSFVKILFGYGLQGLSIELGMGAHNEFIEILVCFGVIGFISFITVFAYFMKKIVMSYKKTKDIFYIVISVFILMMMCFSSFLFVYKYMYFIMLTLVVGFYKSTDRGNYV